MEKQRGQDLGQKTMFFHPKIPKICVTWVNSEKGTISYSHRPMFKISSYEKMNYFFNLYL